MRLSARSRRRRRPSPRRRRRSRRRPRAATAARAATSGTGAAAAVGRSSASAPGATVAVTWPITVVAGVDGLTAAATGTAKVDSRPGRTSAAARECDRRRRAHRRRAGGDRHAAGAAAVGAVIDQDARGAAAWPPSAQPQPPAPGLVFPLLSPPRPATHSDRISPLDMDTLPKTWAPSPPDTHLLSAQSLPPRPPKTYSSTKTAPAGTTAVWVARPTYRNFSLDSARGPQWADTAACDLVDACAGAACAAPSTAAKAASGAAAARTAPRLRAAARRGQRSMKRHDAPRVMFPCQGQKVIRRSGR